MRNWRHKLLLACAIFGFATMTRSQTLSSCVAATHGEDSSECDEITTVGNLQIESKGRYFRISILDGEQVAQEIIYD
ncbi:MAG: hypothetical protein KDD48_09355, partial [Bdellovibrionales bacterium]|nr:hypothetical protein [Bdellovibrionales bacterium]